MENCLRHAFARDLLVDPVLDDQPTTGDRLAEMPALLEHRRIDVARRGPHHPDRDPHGAAPSAAPLGAPARNLSLPCALDEPAAPPASFLARTDLG